MGAVIIQVKGDCKWEYKCSDRCCSPMWNAKAIENSKCFSCGMSVRHAIASAFTQLSHVNSICNEACNVLRNTTRSLADGKQVASVVEMGFGQTWLILALLLLLA